MRIVAPALANEGDGHDQMLQHELLATEVGEMAQQTNGGTGNDSTKAIGEGIGGVAGAAAGAAVGSLAGPIGTAIGAIAGAAGGWWSGRAAVDAASNIDRTDDDYYRQRFTETSRGGEYD